MGYQYWSVSGGAVQYPPLGSGLRLQPTNPSSRTQRSSSAMDAFRSAPGDCGSWQTPMNVSGNSPATRAMRSLQARDHSTLTRSSPWWWPMADARGEKIVMSAPRSRRSLSWFCSIDSRISSSEMAG